jgi:hypothetical protein
VLSSVPEWSALAQRVAQAVGCHMALSWQLTARGRRQCIFTMYAWPCVVCACAHCFGKPHSPEAHVARACASMGSDDAGAPQSLLLRSQCARPAGATAGSTSSASSAAGRSASWSRRGCRGARRRAAARACASCTTPPCSPPSAHGGRARWRQAPACLRISQHGYLCVKGNLKNKLQSLKLVCSS